MCYTDHRFSKFGRFPFRGGRGGGSEEDRHDFPFLRIVELFERSLNPLKQFVDQATLECTTIARWGKFTWNTVYKVQEDTDQQ